MNTTYYLPIRLKKAVFNNDYDIKIPAADKN